MKEQHKTLNKLLPDDIRDMLGKYEMCKKCERFITYHQQYKTNWENNKDHYRARKTIRYLLFDFVDNNTKEPILTTRDYKNITIRSRHKLKKQMLKFIVTPQTGIFEYPAQFLNYLLYDDCIHMDFKRLSQISTGEHKEIVKAIFLELFDYLQMRKRNKYNITERELYEYLEDRMK